MAAAQRENAKTAFRAPANAFATPALTAPRPQRTPAQRPSRAPAPAVVPASRPRQREQTARMFLMIFMAAITVLCGVAYLWGQASLTREGYRHSQLQKMLMRERDMAQQWKHEQAALSTQAVIEQKAQEQGMVRASEGDIITAGVVSAPSPSSIQPEQP